MSEFKAFTPEELQGHQIGISCPSPEYAVIVHDLASGLRIDNATGFTVTWDGSALSASLHLSSGSAQVSVHDMHATALLADVQAEPEVVSEPALALEAEA